MTLLLTCRGIGKSFGEKQVLKNIDLDISRGDRIGLVGSNGAGKTTLANIITGSLDYDQGVLLYRQHNLEIGYMQQRQDLPEITHHKLTGEAGEMETDFLVASSRMGLRGVQHWEEERLQGLSGGERTKLALATVWAGCPDLLILDEPTNHLDYQGVEWLIKELKQFAGAVLLISHDRYFLDRTVNQIAEIEAGSISLYAGNYSYYREEKQRNYQSQLHTYQSQQKEQQRIEAVIGQLKDWSAKAHRESRQKGGASGNKMGTKEYFRAKAKKRDQAVKSQIKKLERMRGQGLEKPPGDPRIRLDIGEREKTGRRLIQADNIVKAYGENLLFKNSSFYINRGDRVGVFGPNGCGKSTLLRILLGQETVDAGEVFLSPSARLAFISQDLAIDDHKSTLQIIADREKSEGQQLITLIVNLGLSFDRLQQRLSALSQGEQVKIQMALALIGGSDLLVLDEPTNHLDLYSRESLEEALSQYSGTILLVSHDRFLLERVCTSLLVFERQQVIRIEGKLDGYLNQQPQGQAASQRRADKKDELLLLDTRMAYVLGELARCQPGDSRYEELDREYNELLEQKRRLN